MIACALAFLLLPAAAATAASVTWTEVGDAGQLIGTAQRSSVPKADTLTSISGNLTAASDHDIFEIYIPVGSAFSATTHQFQ